MKRRHLLFAPFALAMTAPARGSSQPWSARLLKGGFDGKVWRSGLEVTLEPNWKTYWRVPGDGGIAPLIELTGENVSATRVDYPLPKRFIDGSGTVIGYKEVVVFPVAVTPTRAESGVKVSIKSFFGVCDVVCIPAQFSGDIAFDPARADSPDQALISRWDSKVPKASAIGPVMSAKAGMNNGSVELILQTTQSINGIFVEGKPTHYFGNPVSTHGRVAMTVSGVKSLEELQGTALHITIDTKPSPLVQVVTVN